MGTGFAKRKKQAKMMQAQIGKLQQDMQNIEATGTAGGGLVTITLTGDHEFKSIRIKPECVDKEDIEALEDLIKLAFKDASTKLQAQMPSFPGMPSF